MVNFVMGFIGISCMLQYQKKVPWYFHEFLDTYYDATMLFWMYFNVHEFQYHGKYVIAVPCHFHSTVFLEYHVCFTTKKVLWYNIIIMYIGAMIHLKILPSDTINVPCSCFVRVTWRISFNVSGGIWVDGAGSRSGWLVRV